MFVKDRMTSPAVTITSEMPFQEALRLMGKDGLRRLPVVDADNQLIGIVSERELLHASPSPATSLSVWELNYLLSQLTVSELMTKKVVIISPDVPIEVAAMLMVEQKVGGMPVVDENNRVVGVITETDIFKAFVELIGSSEPGLRLMLKAPAGRGTLAKLASAIADMGGNILSVVTFAVGEEGQASLVVKVEGVSQNQLVDTLEALGVHVVDIREV